MLPTPLAPTAQASLERKLAEMRSRLRPGQQRLADWQSGALAVSAVPGSGKSTGMAIAAAILLAKRMMAQADGTLPMGQLVLVTFTRSAVANLKNKIRQCLKDLGLPAQGFQVYTLHGLALNIANRHPDLSGIDLNRMTLVSPNHTNRLIRTCVEQWITANPIAYQGLIEGQQFDGEETERLRRQSVLRTEVLPDLAMTVIHEAKSSGLTPEDLYQLGQQRIATPRRIVGASEVEELADYLADYDVLSIAAGLYERYQEVLEMKGFIDYDEMILAALRVLDQPSARQFWRSQIFAVFEDEAQDSSPLQTQLIELLAGATLSNKSGFNKSRSSKSFEQANLVRVGDPNQAINSTFTPADPSFFREFCETCAECDRLAEMDQAGRSAPIIMAAANYLVDWVNGSGQLISGQLTHGQATSELSTILSQPFRAQHIHPVSTTDPQEGANPTSEGSGLELRFPSDIYHSVALLASRVATLLSDHPERNAAVLVRENRQGRFLADALKNPKQYNLDVDLEALGISVYDVGDRDRHSHIPAEILTLLQFLDRPHSPDNLKAALQVLVDRQRVPTQDLNAIAALPEQFLYPSPIDPIQPEAVLQARRYCAGLLRARLELPQYQLISFLAMTLQYDQSELATADKLAARIAQQTMFNQSLGAVLETLGDIVRSERFEPVETDDPEERYIRQNQLTIMTMHKAKGLDWDYVFIPFLHDNLIPGQMYVPPQVQFLGEFNLSSVARAQIRASVHRESPLPDTLTAWERAKHLKTAEEYRLLYVAMTRAKRLLWMSAARQAPFTWSKPERLCDRLPCPVLPALAQQFPESHYLN
jgi:DNA helicase II / ATP-dependent DNA helicase PcrA